METAAWIIAGGLILAVILVALAGTSGRTGGHPRPGVTMDSGYRIRPVDRMPTEPATPPSAPSGVSGAVVITGRGMPPGYVPPSASLGQPARAVFAHCPGCQCGKTADDGS